MYDASTKKGQASTLTRKWRNMTILERVSDLNYRVCDSNTGKVMRHPVHVDRLRKMNLNHDLWFMKYPDTEEMGTLTQTVGTNPHSDLNTRSQTVSNDQNDTNATQQRQSQDITDKAVDKNDNKLPTGWFSIDRLLAKRKSHGVTFLRRFFMNESALFKVLWTDLGVDGKAVTTWEPSSSVTQFAIDRYNLSLDAKRKHKKRPQK
jgi:hypothetical protein